MHFLVSIKMILLSLKNIKKPMAKKGIDGSGWL